MKSIPKKTPSRMSLAEVEALAKRDKRRLILLGVAAVLLGAGYFGTRSIGDRYEDREIENAPQIVTPVVPEQVFTPDFDSTEVLDAIDDSSAEARLAVNDEALTALLYYATLLTPTNYAALSVRELDRALAGAIASDPAGHRVQALRVRGSVEQIAKRQRQGTSLQEYYATVRLEDDSFAHIAFITPPDEEIEAGDFIRMDGVFVQGYRAEIGADWRDAPLIAGRHVVASVPRGTVKDAETLRADLMRVVEDDQLDDVSGVPKDALWDLMAYTQELGEGVDWEGSLELTVEQINGLVEDGEVFRGVPYRIPISTNLGSWTEAAGENPLRLERVTKGWIGNYTWTGKAGLIQWIAPFDRPDLVDHDGAAHLVTARGFFLKNLYYEQGNGNPGRAPLFVMTGVDIFEPVYDPTTQYILWGVLGATVMMIALIWFLMKRDAKSSAQLQEDLVRRRRARRVRAGVPEAAPETS